MKKLVLMMTLIVSCHIGFGQVNPENIIIEYDLLDGTKRIRFKDELSRDLDSLSSYLIDEKRKELMSTKDSATIRSLIVGSWILKNSVRINGDSTKLRVCDKYIFKENGVFTLFTKHDTVEGKWFVEISDLGNLKLEFDEPQVHIKDKEVLKYLDKELIEEMTYSSNILAINKIDNQQMVFSAFMSTPSENINDMHFRLVLTTYIKDE